MLPVNPAYERDWGYVALIFLMAGGLAAVGYYHREGRDFTPLPLFTTLVACALLASPFIAASYRYQFGLPAELFATVSVIAYWLFYGAMGFLIGGLWIVLAKAIKHAVSSAQS